MAKGAFGADERRPAPGDSSVLRSEAIEVFGFGFWVWGWSLSEAILALIIKKQMAATEWQLKPCESRFRAVFLGWKLGGKLVVKNGVRS